MKKMLAGMLMLVLMAALMTEAAYARASWKALAIYGNGWGFGRGSSESEARTNAIFQCKLVNPSCSWGTSVKSNWTLVGIECQRNSYTAGSEHGLQQAIANAMQKAIDANDYNCDFVVAK